MNAKSIRILFALGWTVLIAVLMLRPGMPPTTDAPSSPSIDLSNIGHLVVFGMMFALWVWALQAYMRQRWALVIAAIGVLVFGAAGEWVQACCVRNRTASIYDFIGDALGIVVVWGGLLLMKLDVRTILRWTAALGYTALMIAYLLQQPGAPTVEIVAPVAAPYWQREIAFTMGHIVGFGTLFLLWLTALRPHTPARAWIAAVVVALSVGLVVEALQSQIPDRSASLYDMVMNTVGIGLASVVQRVRRW
jgi:VanZ family protein